MPSQRVVFVQKFVPHYRLPFFERVKSQLESDNIEFSLVYGPPDPFEGSKVKTVSPNWGTRTDSRIFNVRGRYVYWQNALKHVRKGDLVVVEHAAKLLDNYPLFILGLFGYLKLSYFGHGEDFLADGKRGLAHWLRRITVSRVARWFAYTEIARQSLQAQGVADEKVSVVNNTLVAPPVPDGDIERKPSQFIYIGGLYDHKKIPFLLEACEHLATLTTHEFRLLIVGEGPLQDDVREAANEHPWLDYLGSKYGSERHRLLAESAAILLPGAVGLVAIDSFHFATPLVTIASKAHGPEVAYLVDGENAVVLAPNAGPSEYADTLRDLLENPTKINTLQDGCHQASEFYTMDAMVDNFCRGVRDTFGAS